jgi:hypothetical protein
MVPAQGGSDGWSVWYGSGSLLVGRELANATREVNQVEEVFSVFLLFFWLYGYMSTVDKSGRTGTTRSGMERWISLHGTNTLSQLSFPPIESSARSLNAQLCAQPNTEQMARLEAKGRQSTSPAITLSLSPSHHP